MATKKNPKSPALMSDLWAVANELSAAVEANLNKFAADMVGWQQKLNQTWNTANVIVRALNNKGLLTEEDISRAGRELMEEAGANMKVTKEAMARKERVKREDLLASPVEVLTAIVDKSSRVDKPRLSVVPSGGGEDGEVSPAADTIPPDAPPTTEDNNAEVEGGENPS